MQIVVLARNLTTKNNKFFLRTFKNVSKVENLLSFYSKIWIYLIKVADIKDEFKTQSMNCFLILQIYLK